METSNLQREERLAVDLNIVTRYRHRLWAFGAVEAHTATVDAICYSEIKLTAWCDVARH